MALNYDSFWVLLDEIVTGHKRQCDMEGKTTSKTPEGRSVTFRVQGSGFFVVLSFFFFFSFFDCISFFDFFLFLFFFLFFDFSFVVDIFLFLL